MKRPNNLKWIQLWFINDQNWKCIKWDTPLIYWSSLFCVGLDFVFFVIHIFGTGSFLNESTLNFVAFERDSRFEEKK